MARQARYFKVALVLFGLAALLQNNILEAGGTKSDSEVKVSAVATKPDSAGKQIVTITLVHNKDWHTYANPVGNDEYKSNQTIINIKAKTKPASVKIDYPAGMKNKDKLNVYEDKTEIKATVVRAEGDTSPLEVSVRITACNDKRGTCLLPATVKLTVGD